MEAQLKAKLVTQRSAKRKRDQLSEALTSLSACDLSVVSQLEDKRAIDAILCLKFEQDVISAISYIAQELPTTLPVTTRNSIISDVVAHAPLKVSREDAIELYHIFSGLKGLELRENEPSPTLNLANCETPLFCVLKPPCCSCLECGGALSHYNTPSKVTLFTLTDVKPGLKITLKCSLCGIFYGYAQFGDSSNGYKFYDTPRRYIEASNVTYIERKLCLNQIFLANHGWVSFEAFAEAYNETVEVHETTMKRFIQSNPDQRGKFMERISRKTVSDSFYQHEIEAELRDRHLSWAFKGNDEDSLRAILIQVNELRSSEIYPHTNEDCSETCASRGCRNFTSMDGIWKLRFPHCMYPVETTVAGFESLHYPDVCTNAPYGKGSAFCQVHCLTAQERSIPTNLRQFLTEFCGVSSQKTADDGDDFSEEDISLVRMKTRQMHRDEITQSLVAKQQGTAAFIDEHKQLLQLDSRSESASEDACNKDTGGNQKCLQKWSRGLLHFVRGGGHIESWSPLYLSESPGQVFLLAIHYLYRRLKDLPEEEWENFILSYDNMCNVCKMVCVKKPLPLEPPFDKMWFKITKVIDRLHLRNHKNRNCHEIYSPEPLKEKYPHLNTPVAEQVFTWSARFKKILCAMPQERFLFYYHRMVVRRNRYTSKCHREQRTPVFPKVRSQFTT